MYNSSMVYLPLVLLAASLTQPTLAAEPRRILCLGDSITRGVRSGVTRKQTFEAQLQKQLSRQELSVEVINSGIGGERTDQALNRLARDVVARKPHIVCVMYGTNDSAIDEGKDSPRLPLSSYRKNLETMVDRLRAAEIQPVLMTPIPLCRSFVYNTRRPYKERGPNHMLIDYVHAVRYVALSKGTALVDHFGAWSEGALMGVDLDSLTTDGCHPNAEGHRLIAQTMYPVLAVMLGADPTPPTTASASENPAAETPDSNLALHCRYEESAHNAFGYSNGLTDGVKTSDSKSGVYATDGEPNYPKTTTIDLEEIHQIDRVVVHNSTDGSTRTVAVSISADGTEFTEIGRHRFACGDGAAVPFAADLQKARYVRLSFEDSWKNRTHGSTDFMFLREVEVFGR